MLRSESNLFCLVYLVLTHHRELLKYLTELVDKRLEEPKDDLVSRLVTEHVKPGNLSKPDAVQMAFLLLVAGNATMVSMIALVSFPLFRLVHLGLHYWSRR